MKTLILVSLRMRYELDLPCCPAINGGYAVKGHGHALAWTSRAALRYPRLFATSDVQMFSPQQPISPPGPTPEWLSIEP